MARPAQTLPCVIQERYRSVRQHSELLATPLSDEDCQLQSMPDASPAKWHLGHTSWFFEAVVLQAHQPDYQVFHPRFNFLFNSYYESLGPRHLRPQRGVLSRPSRSEVMDYRAHVDHCMIALIENGPEEEIHALIELGLQHEQQHQELLLMDIKHAFSCNPLLPAYRPLSERPRTQAPEELRWLPHDAGRYRIGADADAGFAYDNETPAHDVWLQDFAISDRLVSNAEYLTFIEDGGYAEPRWWLSDGWARVQQEQWQAPLYWQHRDGQWWQFGLHGQHALIAQAPVQHLSYYEADAYARWAGARLPTEQEWEIAAGKNPVPDSHALHLEPGHAPPGSGDFYNQVWQWTASAYAPYPGFRPAAGAVSEYNGKFMCNQMVLRGGCVLTPPGHVRSTYRNFFYPHQRWVCSGIRLARDD